METKTIHKDSGWRLFLRTIIARAYPRIVGQQREPSHLVFETLLPFMATVGYVYVYRAMQAPEDYIGFAVLGGAMTAFWMNVIWSMSAQLYWEKETGNLALYIISPASLMALLIGMALGGMLATALRASFILVMGWLVFDVHFAVASLLQLIGSFVLTLIALYGLGALFGSFYLLFSREARQISEFLHEPVYFLAGVYFPIKNFGFAVALVSSILPLTLGMDAMRQLAFTDGSAAGFLPVPIEIGALAVMAIVFVLAAKIGLDRIEQLAVREGTITVSRS